KRMCPARSSRFFFLRARTNSWSARCTISFLVVTPASAIASLVNSSSRSILVRMWCTSMCIVHLPRRLVLPLAGHALALRGAFGAALVRFGLDAIADGAAGGGGGQAALGSLAQSARQGPADAHHRLDHFIHRDH